MALLSHHLVTLCLFGVAIRDVVRREVLRLQHTAVFTPAAAVSERTALLPALHAGHGRAGYGEDLVAEFTDLAADDRGVAVDGDAPCVDWAAEVGDSAGCVDDGVGAGGLTGGEGR